MKKIQLIEAILNESQIHHNIRIQYSKLPDFKDDDDFEWNRIAEWLIDQFKADFENIEITPQNDCGNRNLGKNCELKGEVWTTGRMGATLYWDAYWSEQQGHLNGFKYCEEELEEMPVPELRAILKDIQFFNEKVKELMNDFYEELAQKLEERRREKKEEAKDEKLYTKTLKLIEARSWKRRLINDLID